MMQLRTKKILLCLMALAVIMACAPVAAVAPAPTLDPNVLHTFIVQTANAASTMTASVPTVTATATLPNTSTPIPTFTAVDPIVFPTSTPVSRMIYFRVRHDSQLAIYNFKSRTAENWPIPKLGLQTPEVYPLFVNPDSTSGTNRTRLDGNWEIYVDALNGNDRRKLNYLKAKNSGLFNGAGYPQLESLTMGGNLVTLDEISNGWGRLHTISYTQPGALKNVNYLTRPDLVHKFVVVGWDRPTKRTYWVNPPPGDIYWPLVSSRPVWIPMENLEAFPDLPMVVTANTKQPIREQPEMKSPLTKSNVSIGQKLYVVDYHPAGSSVWGRISSGWILLLDYQNGPITYPTSWQMATLPPIP